MFFFLLSSLLTVPIAAFIPNNVIGQFFRDSRQHTEITEETLLTVLTRYYQTKGYLSSDNYCVPKSSALLFEDVYGSTSGVEYDSVEAKIKDEVANVDFNDETKKNPKWHFDAEQFIAGHENLQNIFEEALSNIGQGNFDQPATLIGKALHPLQDFYSHSNWIEMNKEKPYENLGIPNVAFDFQIAGANEDTCEDCGSTSLGSLLALAKKVIHELGLMESDCNLSNLYACTGNIIVNEKLTSGYSVNQKLDNGSLVQKPAGKCSHGGVADGSSNNPAKGGINKDAHSKLLSPHWELHDDAASMAVKAGVVWIEKMKLNMTEQAFKQLFGIANASPAGQTGIERDTQCYSSAAQVFVSTVLLSAVLVVSLILM